MQDEVKEQPRLASHAKSSLISKMQRDYYDRDGFLIIHDFIPATLCDGLVAHTRELIRAHDPGLMKTIFSGTNQGHEKQQYFLDSGDKVHFFYEEGAFNENGDLLTNQELCINKIGHALHDKDPLFYCFSRINKISALLKELNIEDPAIVQSMYVCKQPEFGGEVSCHQDSTYLFVQGAPVTGLWFALEDSTMQNGCLWAIPGGHRTPLKSRMLRDRNNHVFTQVYDDTPWEIEKMIPIEVPRGSLVVMHGLLPHMSKRNVSTSSRHAYTLHVMSQNDKFAEDNWLRKDDGQPFSNL